MTKITFNMHHAVDEEAGSLLHLFEARKPIYQAKVRGTFRHTKWVVMLVLLGIYYLLPWVRWPRGVGAPDQAVLVDVMQRKFYFFFIELWPQEIYYFTGLLLLAALGLFLATALFGRVWCGYACPQTVWTDLFFHVERWLEGDRNAQMKLAAQPWGWDKLSKKVAKHLIWIVIGVCTGGAWVFYFQDAPTLWHNMLRGQFDFVPTFWILFLTGSTYLMAGFAREQVCTYMCPYARFQGAMFDEDSLIVTYDKARGEPRGNATGAGDCVDCGRCVAVCPVGIDIRDGQQYRCINCALCIDACAAVMQKLQRPKGLIRYNTLNGNIPAHVGVWEIFKTARLLRPRTVLYVTVMVLVGGTMLYSLLHRAQVELNVLHQRNPLYVKLSNGQIRNIYTVRLLNKTWQTQTFALSASLPHLILHIPNLAMRPHQVLNLPVGPGKVAEYTLLADLTPQLHMPTHQKLVLQVTAAQGTDRYETVFIAPDIE